MLHDQRTTALLFLLSLLLIQTLISSAADGPELRVKEGEDVVLPCSFNKDITSTTFEWTKDSKEVYLYQNNGEAFGNRRHGQDKQFKGRTSHFQDELSKGNASIKINKTKLDDRGIYTCSFINPSGQKRPTFSVQLVVECILKDRTAEKKPGACPKPYVKPIPQSDGPWLLHCKVCGASPKPAVEWRDSSGNRLQAEEKQTPQKEGTYDIFLQTTVTKTDNYSCVVTQNDICHEVYDDLSVIIPEQPPEPTKETHYGWIIGVLVVVVLVLAGVVCWLCRTRNSTPGNEALI